MEVEILNPEPTYAKFYNIIDKELALKLKNLCKVHGTTANYHGCDALEYKVPNAYVGNLSRDTVEVLPELHEMIITVQEMANNIFANTAMSGITTHAGYWIMQYKVGGCFDAHVDFSTDDETQSTPALATLVINLSEPEEYEGGKVFLSGKQVSSEYCGGLLWDGWTEHWSLPTTSGIRSIMVVHFLGLLKQ